VVEDWSLVAMSCLFVITGGWRLVARRSIWRGERQTVPSGWFFVLLGTSMLLAKIPHMAGWPHPLILTLDGIGLLTGIAGFMVAFPDILRRPSSTSSRAAAEYSNHADE